MAPRLALFAVAALPLAAAQQHNFPGADATALIPWLDASDGVDWTNPVSVDVRFSSTADKKDAAYPEVDTGSQGIVFGAERKALNFTSTVNCTQLIHKQDLDFDCEAAGGEQGWEYLDSSDRLYQGCWVQRDLYFNVGTHSEKSPLVHSRVKLLVAVCTSVCRNLTHKDSPKVGCADQDWAPSGKTGAIEMFGIGFGRESGPHSNATPDKNPMRNVVDIAGQDMSTFYNGYMLTKFGIQVGLTDALTQGMRFYPLQAKNMSQVPPGVHDWQGPQVGISVDGGPTAWGSALLDTGLNYSFLEMPNGTPWHLALKGKDEYVLADGSRVDIVFADPGTGYVAATQSYVVGGASASDPHGTSPAWVVPFYRSPTFVNTGRLFYRGFDIAFDDKKGWFGLRTLPVEHNVSNSLNDQRPVRVDL